MLMEGIQFPVGVTNWVFVESGDVFECPPFLCVVSWLFSVEHKFAEVSVSFLGKSSTRLVIL